MKDSDGTFVQRATEAAIPGIGLGEDGSGEHPDENLLAGYAEGRLMEEERGLVEAHLPGCESCRELVVVLGGEVALAEGEVEEEGRDSAPTPIHSFRWRRPLLVAAGLLVAVSVGIIGKLLLFTPEDYSTRVLGERTQLAQAHPELFVGLDPFDPEGPIAPTLRDTGPRLLLPAGTELELRPEFRWENFDGEGLLSWSKAGGGKIFEQPVTASPLPYPSEAPTLEADQTYLWRLTSGPAGAETVTLASFRTATDGERLRFLQAKNAIEKKVSVSRQELWTTVYALKHSHLGEAERAAREAVEAEPEESLPRELLRRVLEAIGSSEARDLDD